MQLREKRLHPAAVVYETGMKLVSTTLTGNASAMIGDALGSVVSWVDACLVIDTGATDGTLSVARSVAKDKYVERSFAWTDDFSAARNFALDAAHEIGGDWAVTLDTDERIVLGGQDIRATLAAATEGALMLSSTDGTYAKERFFRLPMPIRWTGPTHESFPAYKVKSRIVDGASFAELPKSVEASRRKFERDVSILEAYTRSHPTDPRWHYYLGESHKNLGHNEQAIVAYEACASLRGWDEESAWACYRAAECHALLGAYDRAIDACASGLARHAGIAELSWLAAFSAFRAGRHAQAVYFARLSIAMGHFRGAGASVPRIGFRNRNALYEGPYDVLRFALRALGDSGGADEAERQYHEAIRARETGRQSV
jgi:tetratricopeptide (TPR) repeat protein